MSLQGPKGEVAFCAGLFQPKLWTSRCSASLFCLKGTFLLPMARGPARVYFSPCSAHPCLECFWGWGAQQGPWAPEEKHMPL